jgi:hypothetical protein
LRTYQVRPNSNKDDVLFLYINHKGGEMYNLELIGPNADLEIRRD